MNDYEKLLSFSALIGIPVKYGKKQINDAAYFVYDGMDSHIEICGKKQGTLGILTLLHELGHAFDWIQQGRPRKPPSFLGVQLKTRKQRYQLWLNERNGINNTVLLHRLLQLEVPKYQLETERLVDLWIYNFFYRKGKYPTLEERKKKWKQVHANCVRLYK